MKAKKKIRKISLLKRIEQQNVLRFLITPAEQQFLVPLMQQEKSVAELSQQLGMDFGLVYRKVQGMYRAGLLELARVQKRHGRGIRYYRAVAEKFFIPNQVLPIETIIAQTENGTAPRFFRGLARTILEETSQLGTVCSVGQHNNMVVRLGLENGEIPPNNAAVCSFWAQLRLDYQDAKRLEAQMIELMQQYQGLNGKDTYLMRIGLTPCEALG